MPTSINKAFLAELGFDEQRQRELMESLETSSDETDPDVASKYRAMSLEELFEEVDSICSKEGED